MYLKQKAMKVYELCYCWGQTLLWCAGWIWEVLSKRKLICQVLSLSKVINSSIILFPSSNKHWISCFSLCSNSWFLDSMVSGPPFCTLAPGQAHVRSWPVASTVNVRKEMWYNYWKGDKIIIICSWFSCLYREHPRESIETLIDLTREFRKAFSKMAEYQSIIFL